MSSHKDKIQIYKPDFYGKRYGGNLYDYRIYSLLNKSYDFEWINANKGHKKLLTPIAYASLLFKSKFKKESLVFLNFLSLPFFPLFNPNTVVLIHHIDWSRSPFFSKLYQMVCYSVFRLFKNKWQTVVVVSNYWKENLEKMGFKNVKIIFNSIQRIDEKFMLSKSDFLKKYNLPPNRNFIYLGNAQKGKGWAEAYEALLQMDVEFIITGVSNNIEKLPQKIHYLYLPYLDYQTMLKYAECTVLLSNFTEGWNRIAHESMLQQTPVIGSGTGGMKELLENGKQIICKDVTKLSQLAGFAIQNRETLGNDGFNYVKQFDLEYFKNAWEEVFRTNHS